MIEYKEKSFIQPTVCSLKMWPHKRGGSIGGPLCFHLDLNEKSRQGKNGGGLRFLAGRTQEGGGGSFRCVLCATGGVGVSKNWEKMRM